MPFARAPRIPRPRATPASPAFVNRAGGNARDAPKLLKWLDSLPAPLPREAIYRPPSIRTPTRELVPEIKTPPVQLPAAWRKPIPKPNEPDYWKRHALRCAKRREAQRNRHDPEPTEPVKPSSSALRGFQRLLPRPPKISRQYASSQPIKSPVVSQAQRPASNEPGGGFSQIPEWLRHAKSPSPPPSIFVPSGTDKPTESPTNNLEQASFHQITSTALSQSPVESFDQGTLEHQTSVRHSTTAHGTVDRSAALRSENSFSSESTDGTPESIRMEIYAQLTGPPPGLSTEDYMRVIIGKEQVRKAGRSATRRAQRRKDRHEACDNVSKHGDRPTSPSSSFETHLETAFSEHPVEPVASKDDTQDDSRFRAGFKAIVGEDFTDCMVNAMAGLAPRDELDSIKSDSDKPTPHPQRGHEEGDTELLAKIQAQWIAEQKTQETDANLDQRSPTPIPSSPHVQHASDSEASIEQEPLPKVTLMASENPVNIFDGAIEEAERRAREDPQSHNQRSAGPEIFPGLALRTEPQEVLHFAVAASAAMISIQQPEEQQQPLDMNIFRRFHRKAIALAKSAWTKVKGLWT